MRKLLVVWLTLLGSAAFASSATAGHHNIRIRKFFPGTALEPNAQYVELQMIAEGQVVVGGFSLVVLDSTGSEVGTFTFPGFLSNGLNQSSILIATPEAEAFFGITADLTMTPVLDVASGRMCFAGSVDCVSWGSYAAFPSVGSGTPFGSPDALELGWAVRRDISAGDSTLLEARDDTNDSDGDFDYAFPVPRNNAGDVGVPPASTCGNGVLEGLEQCDDGNTTAGDGCNPLCITESVCGNGILETGEECDDGNLDPFDGCDAICVIEVPVCGNGIVEFGEGCDDGNTTTGDGCDQVCQIEPICPIIVTGDVDVTGTLTSTDIISLVNYVFKSGPNPMPCAASGDVNCDGGVTSTDIIFMVNHVFKSGPVPCDVCSIFPAVWTCP